MAAYAATAIRNKYPDAKIWWAVESRCAAVVDDQRLVTEKVLFPRDRWKKSKFRPANWREQLALYRRLGAEKFDYGIDLQGHSKTAMTLAMAKPKRKFAAAATDLLARRITPVVPGDHPHLHIVERSMRVLAQIGDFELPERPIMPDISGRSKAIFEELGSPRSLVTIAASAGQDDKAYPIDLWNTVARALIDDGNQVLFIGGPGDPKPAAEGVLDRVGAWSLEDTMAAIAGSRLIVAADTGAGHIAGAYGKPVVSIFGPSEPDRFKPVVQAGIVLRNGTETAATKPEEVIAAVRGVLGNAEIPR